MPQQQTDAELIAQAKQVWEAAPSGPVADQCAAHHRACACRQWADAVLVKALAEALERAQELIVDMVSEMGPCGICDHLRDAHLDSNTFCGACRDAGAGWEYAHIFESQAQSENAALRERLSEPHQEALL